MLELSEKKIAKIFKNHVDYKKLKKVKSGNDEKNAFSHMFCFFKWNMRRAKSPPCLCAQYGAGASRRLS